MKCHEESVGSLAWLDPSSFELSSLSGWLLLLLFGLVTSGHCVLMCGPLMTYCSRKARKQGTKVYNILRVTGYSLSGALLGYFNVNVIGSITPWILKIMAGLVLTLIVFKTLQLILQARRNHLANCGNKPSCKSCKIAGSNRIARLGPTVGFFSFAIPCMSLTPALLLAFNQSSAIHGFSVMLVFGIATLPAMSGSSLILNKSLNLAPKYLVTGFESAIKIVLVIWASNIVIFT